MLDHLKDLGAAEYPVFYVATAQTYEDRVFDHLRKVCLSRGFKHGEESIYKNLILSYTSHTPERPEWIDIRQAPDEGDNRMILINADQENGACYAISSTDRLWMGMMIMGLTPRG